jgi:hypothetical protein
MSSGRWLRFKYQGRPTRTERRPTAMQTHELDTTTPELFEFMFASFDVREAKRLITAKPRETEMVRTDVLRAFLGPRGITVDRKRVKADPLIDVSVPLIVATLDTSCLPIDGWHRVAKAIAEGIEEIPALYLTREETEQVRG